MATGVDYAELLRQLSQLREKAILAQSYVVELERIIDLIEERLTQRELPLGRS